MAAVSLDGRACSPNTQLVPEHPHSHPSGGNATPCPARAARDTAAGARSKTRAGAVRAGGGGMATDAHRVGEGRVLVGAVPVVPARPSLSGHTHTPRPHQHATQHATQTARHATRLRQGTRLRWHASARTRAPGPCRRASGASGSPACWSVFLDFSAAFRVFVQDFGIDFGFHGDGSRGGRTPYENDTIRYENDSVGPEL